MLVLLALPLLLSACGRAAVPAEYFGQSSYWVTGYEEPTQLVIRDTQSFSKAWAVIYTGHTAPPSLPEFDFSREMLVLVALGTRPTTGFQLELVSSESDGSTLYLAFHELTSYNCFVFASLTFPAALIRVPRLEGPVSISIDQKPRTCG